MAKQPVKAVATAKRATKGAQKAAQASVRRKQAVVVIHGMGEQKPLETLRDFVEAVWGGRPIPRKLPSDDDVWLVPDMRSGQTELARFTTRRNPAGIATDFYELYWSDLLVDNKLSQIRAWITGLLLRWPHQVPRETVILWLMLWAIVGIVAFIAAFVGITGSYRGLRDLLANAEPVQNNWTLAGSVVLTLSQWWFLRWRLTRQLDSWANASKTFPGIWATTSPKQASVSISLSWAVAVLLPPLLGWLAYWYFPSSVLAEPKSWALIVAAGLSVILVGWVAPVFGDVARYVRTSPDAVSARAEIRERGVDLLRALHGPADAVAKKYDFGDPTPYERIVVVGHSLGSIIAYDILRLFWQERGPTSRNPATGKALDALRELDEFCRVAADKPEELDIDAFRRRQADVAAKLAALPDGWLVSDFVTLGSPLSHAEFLISHDRSAFEERKAERLFPVCPPMLEPGSDSFMYPGQPGAFTHHAAMFCAMRWTNIYDPHVIPVVGDFISGPCRPNFGPGVVDLPVSISKGGLFSRFVTHTHYWNPKASGRATDEVGKRLCIPAISKEPKAHLVLLRKALSLR